MMSDIIYLLLWRALLGEKTLYPPRSLSTRRREGKGRRREHPRCLLRTSADIVYFTRSGSCQSASSRQTTTDTLGTSTLSLSHRMDPCVLLEAKMASQCCGSCLTASTFTLWKPATPSMPSSLAPTATGSALPPRAASKVSEGIR